MSTQIEKVMKGGQVELSLGQIEESLKGGYVPLSPCQKKKVLE